MGILVNARRVVLKYDGPLCGQEIINTEGSEDTLLKVYDLNMVVADNVEIYYFYKRERNDNYGNPRYRVYIIDPNTQLVTEKIAKTYDVQDWVHSYIKNSY